MYLQRARARVRKKSGIFSNSFGRVIAVPNERALSLVVQVY